MRDTTPWPDVREWHRPLLLVAAVSAPFVVISLAGIVFDGRVLVGAPIWYKPFRFAVSIVLYALTWSWLVAYLPRRRLVRWSAPVGPPARRCAGFPGILSPWLIAESGKRRP